MAEEEGGGRPKRKNKGGRVIYRECDSDDEDYETFALIRYFDREGSPKPTQDPTMVLTYPRELKQGFHRKRKVQFWVGGNFLWF